MERILMERLDISHSEACDLTKKGHERLGQRSKKSVRWTDELEAACVDIFLFELQQRTEQAAMKRLESFRFPEDDDDDDDAFLEPPLSPCGSERGGVDGRPRCESDGTTAASRASQLAEISISPLCRNGSSSSSSDQVVEGFRSMKLSDGDGDEGGINHRYGRSRPPSQVTVFPLRLPCLTRTLTPPMNASVDGGGGGGGGTDASPKLPPRRTAVIEFFSSAAGGEGTTAPTRKEPQVPVAAAAKKTSPKSIGARNCGGISPEEIFRR